jgi:hypothetical protein
MRRLPAIFLICWQIESTTRASVRDVPFVRPTKNSSTIPFLAAHRRAQEAAQVDDPRVFTDSIVEANGGNRLYPKSFEKVANL